MGAGVVCERCGATYRADNHRGARLANTPCPRCGGALRMPRHKPRAVRVRYPKDLPPELRSMYRRGWHYGVCDADADAGRIHCRLPEEVAILSQEGTMAMGNGLRYGDPWPEGQAAFDAGRRAGREAQAAAIAAGVVSQP